MARFLRYAKYNIIRKGRTILLACMFLSGFAAGIFSCIYANGNSSFYLMRRWLDASVSIVVSLAFLLLPFLFSAFAVFISCPWLLVCVCFLKSFLFGYMSMVFYLLTEAGWLIRGLLIFADCISFPVLYFYWQYHFSNHSTFSPVLFCICAVLVLMFVCLEYCIVFPCAVGLIFQKG